MNREMQVKSQVLDMLKDFLMGNEGGKFKPKAMSVEIIKPEHGGNLEEVLDRASEEHPIEEEMMHAEPDGDEFCEGGMAMGGKVKGYSKGGEATYIGKANRGMGGDDMEGMEFEDMDLEHVDDDGYTPDKSLSNPSKKRMSLKEFLKNK